VFNPQIFFHAPQGAWPHSNPPRLLFASSAEVPLCLSRIHLKSGQLWRSGVASWAGEVYDVHCTGTNRQMAFMDRLPLIKKIEELRGSRVLCSNEPSSGCSCGHAGRRQSGNIRSSAGDTRATDQETAMRYESDSGDLIVTLRTLASNFGNRVQAPGMLRAWRTEKVRQPPCASTTRSRRPGHTTR
jgi:hypothetical protein